MYLYIRGSDRIARVPFLLSFFQSHKRERKMDRSIDDTDTQFYYDNTDKQVRKEGASSSFPQEGIYSVKSTHQPDQTRPDQATKEYHLYFSLSLSTTMTGKEGRGGERRQRRSIDGRRHSSSPKKLPIQFGSTTTT